MKGGISNTTQLTVLEHMGLILELYFYVIVLL